VRLLILLELINFVRVEKNRELKKKKFLGEINSLFHSQIPRLFTTKDPFTLKWLGFYFSTF
jgi:hypothetical protein